MEDGNSIRIIIENNYERGGEGIQVRSFNELALGISKARHANALKRQQKPQRRVS